ncbi:Pentatricopeptide repeat-containing protein -mitochondrial [Striga hermonthica]|uniref:Pentatricopeptide repeat-containing protein -mitochondrial n=1 Tax=Striga hermonthica TaxID=68872 RepID=A0A9N7MPP2_STRHE|nr:Pentatricopeptide repeat-containing protein -mitochondrial [Striga hermonthica]
MRHLLQFPSPPLHPRLLVSFAPRKSLSSSSILETASTTPPCSDSTQANSTSDPENTVRLQKNPISEDTRQTQESVVNALLFYANDPGAALGYFEWVKKRRGFVREIGDSFLVLLHILASSSNYHVNARNLLNNYLAGNFAPSGAVLADRLIHCSEKFGFDIKPRVCSYLMDGYVSAKRYKDAKDCYGALVSRGIMLTPFILNNFLTSLIRAGMVNEARHLFRDTVSNETGLCDRATIYMMMCLSLRESKIEEAQSYFFLAKKSGIKLDAPVYFTAIRAACMQLDSCIAFGLLSEMKKKGWVPPEGTFTYLICMCVKQRNMEDALKLKDEMINSGHSLNLVVATSLIKGYYLQGNLQSSLALFNKIVRDGLVPNKVTYAVVIEGCCVNKNMVRANELFKQMKSAGIRPTVYIVNSLIRGFLKTQSTDEAMKVFDEAVEDGVANVFTYNNLLSWFCQMGRIDDADRILGKMVARGIEPSVVSYNNMILGNCRKGNMDVASKLLSEMIARNLKANVITYSILIDGYFRKGEAEKATGLFDKMVSLGIMPNDFTHNTVINGLCKSGQTRIAKDRMEKFVSIGFNPTCMTYNSLIDGFMKEGDVNSALSVYKEIFGAGLVPNVVTYTTLIDGLCKMKDIDLALKMQAEMQKRGVEMDVKAYNALIGAFSQRKDMKTARELFDEISQVGLSPNIGVYNTMISGFRGLYNMESALDFYERMKNEGVECDLETYTTLIDGLFKVGNIELALEFYRKMLAGGILPDIITYIILVRWLCDKGQAKNACKVLEEMLERNITPNVLIYNTLIAGYFREGNLQEAFRLHEEMLDRGLVPDDTTYDILVSRKFEAHISPKKASINDSEAFDLRLENRAYFREGAAVITALLLSWRKLLCNNNGASFDMAVAAAVIRLLVACKFDHPKTPPGMDGENKQTARSRTDYSPTDADFRSSLGQGSYASKGAESRVSEVLLSAP